MSHWEGVRMFEKLWGFSGDAMISRGCGFFWEGVSRDWIYWTGVL